MDKRSWPWKRKSSDKAAAEKASAAVESSTASSAATKSKNDQDNYKKPSYVQISVEQYSHLTGLEDQVKFYEEQVQTLEDHMKELDEQLSSAQAEITAKDELAKQHAKVAEEAVSGWEKAEAEALALKTHLESVTLSKLTAEDRATHLDGALKECMRQIRNLKEEHEQKLQEVVLTKTKQCEKIKHDLEAKISDLEQQLLRSAAENAAISRSLQERSNMLIQISEEKSQAEAEIEILKGNIESCEREINSLKYELHVASKELEIRNEEKNMSVRSAEVANKQHMEGVKKIAKLEAECQRLRGLVRKRLPGPAALAQMKLEVESLGRDYGDSRLKRSPVKPPNPHLSHMPELPLENYQKFHKENEFLTERLLAMEEETKMLKEALAKRNSELLTSRNMCAKISSKLQSLEGQLQMTGSSPKFVGQIGAEGSLSHNASNPPSLTSMSEDGNDDERSCAESWATALISELSQIKKEKSPGQPNRVDSATHLELMDDFLEMEKLACSSVQSNADSSENKSPDAMSNNAEIVSLKNPESLGTQTSSDVEPSGMNHKDGGDDLPLLKLQSRITSIFESIPKEKEILRILEDIKRAVQDTYDNVHEQIIPEEKCSDASCRNESCPEDVNTSAETDGSLSPDTKPATEAVEMTTQDLAAAVSPIHDFVLFLGKEATAVHVISIESDAFSQKIKDFSVTYHKVLSGNTTLFAFVLELSNVLTKAGELKFNILGFKGVESEIHSPDCIDKVALPENKVVQQDSATESYQNGCVDMSDSTSYPGIPDYGNQLPGYEADATSCKVPFPHYEQLKLEKDNMAQDLARSVENLEAVKTQLRETEQMLAEAKSQLASAQKSNSLSETQLKCMAESYRSLEMRAQELETEVNLLRSKTESLENELQEEKRNHQESLTRCKDLEDQLIRLSSLPDPEVDLQTKQERELAAAAEKLAECQESIFLLGKQLKSLHPQADLIDSERSQKRDVMIEDETRTSIVKSRDIDIFDMDGLEPSNPPRLSVDSAMIVYNSPCSPSDTDGDLLRSPVNSTAPKHQPTLSGSSTASSTPTPEKQPRGFSRFFSSKGKNTH